MHTDRFISRGLARLAVVVLAAVAGLIPAVAAQAWTLSSYAGTDGRLDIMPLGDSLTRGVGDPMWSGYRADLRARFASVGQNPNMVGPWLDGNGDHEHAGTQGARIDQVSVMVPQLMAVFKPDVVLVMAGTNDVSQRYQLDDVQARMVSLIGKIQQYRPSARVFVATIPQWADPARKPDVDQVNAAIVAAVNEVDSATVTIVPVAIVGQDPARDLGSDGVHLTLCGYAKVAFVWWLHMGLSDLKPAADTWGGGFWPWSNTGVCA